jgi:peptidoglycan hydrolase-like protein with peptidoglycan-binding domain
VQHDLAAPERWIESQRRSQSRRLAAARAAARRRIGRRGTVVLLAALSLGAGGAAASQSHGGSVASKTATAAKRAGVSIKSIQAALGVSADGIYGPQTRGAVRRFQRSHGLTVDGIVGPQTLAALGLTRQMASIARPNNRRTIATDASTILERIAQCESGGDPTAISPDGRYRGKYQFRRSTWRGLGGTGDPAKAPEAEQDRLAAALLAEQGTKPWPACGAKLELA